MYLQEEGVEGWREARKGMPREWASQSGAERNARLSPANFFPGFGTIFGLTQSHSSSRKTHIYFTELQMLMTDYEKTTKRPTVLKKQSANHQRNDTHSPH